MKFGDIVVNEWAGDSNPNKVLMVVSVGGHYIKCLTKGGGQVVFYNDKWLRLTKISEVDFSKWFKACDVIKNGLGAEDLHQDSIESNI